MYTIVDINVRHSGHRFLSSIYITRAFLLFTLLCRLNVVRTRKFLCIDKIYQLGQKSLKISERFHKCTIMTPFLTSRTDDT